MSEAPDPPDSTSALAMMQRWFQAVISHPEGVTAGAAAAQGGAAMIEAHLTPSETLDAASRLSVYADAYFARLIECLGEVYPMLRKFLGTEAFDSFAFDYLQEMPSRSYTLHHLGRHFPDWLEASRPRAEAEAGVAPASHGPDWPELLVDLAHLEWALYETFDGPGGEGLPGFNANALLELPPDAWDEVRLTPAPCLHLVTARFPVNDFYTALRQAGDDDPVVPPDAEPAWIALNRRDFIVRRHDLSETSHELLCALLDGLPLGEALERAAALWKGSDEAFGAALQEWFGEWTADGFFVGIANLP